eukprot:scaffold253_cov243-Pinguiococcus_pyrenoidosus.AAC.3
MVAGKGAEVRGEELGVQGRGHDNDAQIVSGAQQIPQADEQEVGLQVALMDLIQYHDSGGAKQQSGALRRPPVQTDLVPDRFSHSLHALFRDALRHTDRADPPGLGADDARVGTVAALDRVVQNELRHLRRLSTAGLPGYDQHPVIPHGFGKSLPLLPSRKTLSLLPHPLPLLRLALPAAPKRGSHPIRRQASP